MDHLNRYGRLTRRQAAAIRKTLKPTLEEAKGEQARVAADVDALRKEETGANRPRLTRYAVEKQRALLEELEFWEAKVTQLERRQSARRG